MEYTVSEHQHRFAAWAAGRAASVNKCRFRVETGKSIIEEIGLHQFCDDLDAFDGSNFESYHCHLREASVSKANSLGLPFTHGVAAKLINCYIKARWISHDPADYPQLNVVHPPIDELLLSSLYQNGVADMKSEWAEPRRIRWSKFSSSDYEAVVSSITKACQLLGLGGLWEIESYWQGHHNDLS